MGMPILYMRLHLRIHAAVIAFSFIHCLKCPVLWGCLGLASRETNSPGEEEQNINSNKAKIDAFETEAERWPRQSTSPCAL